MLGLLKKILPPEEKTFYTLFEESTKVCNEIAKVYSDMVFNGFNEDKIIQAKSLKNKSNDIAKQTLHHLNMTFITPIDREDIQHVATLLNKITRKIVKACVNLGTYRLANHNDNMRKQAETLVKATEELNYIIVLLRKVTQMKEVCESNARMRDIENHGDEILHIAMDDLFSGKYEALDVIKLKDIYKVVENATDTCFSVSDTVVNIVLKHG